MLYVCIPVHNEATTIGVLLWRIRTVLQEYTREYEVVVYDDGSSDETAEVLEPYRRVLPLTVLRAPRQRGTAAALDALCRHVVSHTRYPRRDAVVLMQGDFTDRPEDLPELAKRFEGGADLVVGRRPASLDQPPVERRLRQMAPWVLRPFVRVAEVEDLVTGFRLVRVSVLRDLVRARGDALLADGAGWSATVDFALAVAPYARRVDVVDLPGRYDLRPRASRLDLWRELRELAGYAWRARGRRVAAGDRLGEKPAERPAERAPDRAPDREVAVIGSVSALTAGEAPRRERSEEERGSRGAREKRRPERSDRPERLPRGERPERPKRAPGDAVEAEPRKRLKARREEGPKAEADAAGVAGPEPEATDGPARPARPRRERGAPRAERPPRDAAPPPVGGEVESVESAAEAPLVSPAVAAAEAAEDAAEEALVAGTRKRARRRRRKPRGAVAGGAVAEEGAEPGSGGAAEGGAEGGEDAAGSPAPRAERVVGEGGGDDADGEAEGGSAEGGGDGTARKRRRRRRGRGRGERAAGGEGGADGGNEGGGGTDASGGVGEPATGVGVAAPRAPEPDRAAD